MWVPWETPMWGFWWVFPLLGVLVCLAFLVVAVRFMSTGRGFMCMGGRGGMGDDEAAAMRRETHTLRAEIEQLKASR